MLGYSFIPGAIERIGLWDRHGKFRPHFVQGIPQVPTISNDLLINENDLIVITAISGPAAEIGNSYLVPEPGKRLNLAGWFTTFHRA